MRKLIVSIFLVVALYFLLLNPAFTFMGGRHSQLLLWPFVILLRFNNVRAGINLHKGFLISWFFVLLYIVLRTLMGGIPQYLITHLSLLFGILLAFVLIRIASIYEVDLIKSLLIMACIAGSISCVCLFSPSFNVFTKSIQVITNDYLLENTFRGFGIGDGLTFTYGVILGSICALGICLISKYRWFILFIPIVSGAVLINARTGFVPVIISFLYLLIFERKIKNYVYIFGFVLLLYFMWISFIERLIPADTLEWAKIFFEEIGEGSEGATADVLMSYDVWPDNTFEWIFGKGFSVFEPIKGRRSDVGYSIELCYGGLIYCMLLCIMVWKLIKPAYKKMPTKCFWTFVISLFIFNIKSEYISGNVAFVFLVLIMFYYSQKDIEQVREDKKVLLNVTAN